MYGASEDPKIIEEAKEKLQQAYDKFPETEGCLHYISIPKSEGGCGSWCCELQHPQLFYSEFLFSWHYVINNWTDERIASLVRRSLENYILNPRIKSCVFWDSETKLCTQHLHRPFNCREYGIVPEEEWRPRYERLKVLYPDTPDQCTLIHTKDGSEFTKEQSDDIWEDVLRAEEHLGIDRGQMTDEYDGTYRSYHDHILLHLFGEDSMEHLTEIRLMNNEEKKKECIDNIMIAYWSHLRDIKDHNA